MAEFSFQDLLKKGDLVKIFLRKTLCSIASIGLLLAAFIGVSSINAAQPIHSTQKHVQTNQRNGPLLVPVIMVKNEALVIQETLQPYVDAGIQHFFVFDTGSTDNTIAVTQDFFKQHNIQHGIIKQEPFVNFAVSRNRALDLAERAFPDAVFMIMPDAEWYLQNTQGLLEFCEKHKYAPEKAYAIRIIHLGRADYNNVRVVRCGSGERFSGAVHEYLGGTDNVLIPKDIYFAWNDKEIGLEKSRERWKRDLTILLDEYAKKPHDGRTVFYLAQTHDCLGNLEEAARLYKERALMPDFFNEEGFIAQYRVGIMYEKMGKWDRALAEYLEAFAMRPHRAEPLIRIAEHYGNQKEAAVCHLFSRPACEIDYPINDIMPVEKEAYDFKRYDLLALSSWYTANYELGKKALLSALQKHPDYIHLQRNLESFEQKIVQKNHAKKPAPGILNLHFNSPHPGGIETHIVIQAQQLKEHGLDNYVLTSKHSAHLIDTFNNDPALARSCFTYNHDDFYPREQDIEELIVAKNIALIICNSRGHLAQCINLRKKYPISIVYMHHFLYNFTADDLRRLNQLQAIATADPATAETLKALHASGKLQTPIIEHIAPFFDDQNFLHLKKTHQTKKDFFATTYGITINEQDTVITMVANMYDLAYKNHPLLLKAIEHLALKRNKKFTVILAGDGKERGSLEQIAQTLGIRDRVHFIGKTHQVPELLHHSDIHVLASSHEGFGLAHLEAAMTNKPFVGATHTGFSSYIHNGINGFLFENNNALDLAAKLELLIENPELRILMGKNARYFVQENFSAPVTYEKWRSLLTLVAMEDKELK